MMKMGTGSQVFLAATASAIALSANPAMAQADGDEIIVTGSRIAKSEFTSADPIQVIDPETAKLQGQVQLADILQQVPAAQGRSEEHTSELQSLIRISYAVVCLKQKKIIYQQ